MNCKKCGAELHPEANFCMKCGAKVEKEIFCHACGTTLPEDAAFCFKCGANLQAKQDDAAGYDYYVTDLDKHVWNLEEDVRNTATSAKVAEGMTVCPSFFGWTKLRTVSLPATLQRIGRQCFCETAVERLEIPDGVTEIGSHAFEACKNLKHIHLPRNLRRISMFAFFDCSDELCVEYRGTYMRTATCMHYLEEAGVDVVFD